MMERLTAKDHGEAVAIFRSEIVGALTRRELGRGELRAALGEIAEKRFRPPGSDGTRRFSVATLERWYYAYRQGGLEALVPEPRSDRGRARELTPEQRTLLLEIRREYPSASVPLILRTLVSDGRLEGGAVSAQTVRRLFREQGSIGSGCATQTLPACAFAGKPSGPARCGTATSATAPTW